MDERGRIRKEEGKRASEIYADFFIKTVSPFLHFVKYLKPDTIKDA